MTGAGGRGAPEALLLERYPALGGLEPALRAQLLEAALPVAFAAGRVLFRVGQACEGLLFVLEGSVRVALLGEAGHEILLYRVGPGETCVLTTACLLGGRAYPAEGAVEEPVRGLLLPAPQVEALLEASTAFRRFALAQIGERLAHLLALVSEVAFRRTDARLAAWLAERATRQGPTLKVTHEGIARELGTAREVVSRLLKELERQGLVRLGRGSVEVEPGGLASLRRLAGRDVAALGDEITDGSRPQV